MHPPIQPLPGSHRRGPMPKQQPGSVTSLSIATTLALLVSAAPALAAPRVFDLAGPQLRAEVWDGAEVMASSAIRVREGLPELLRQSVALEIELPDGLYE